MMDKDDRAPNHDRIARLALDRRKTQELLPHNTRDSTDFLKRSSLSEQMVYVGSSTVWSALQPCTKQRRIPL
jgi:hypothetical protein